MASPRGIAWNRIRLAALSAMVFVLAPTLVHSWDRDFQSYSLKTCEDMGADAADASTVTFCLGFGTAPFGIGIPCAKCTLTASANWGSDGVLVPAGTGETTNDKDCGLVRVGICDLRNGVRNCFNMQFLFNPGYPGQPVGCSSMPNAIPQSTDPS